MNQPIYTNIVDGNIALFIHTLIIHLTLILGVVANADQNNESACFQFFPNYSSLKLTIIH